MNISIHTFIHTSIHCAKKSWDHGTEVTQATASPKLNKMANRKDFSSNTGCALSCDYYKYMYFPNTTEASRSMLQNRFLKIMNNVSRLYVKTPCYIYCKSLPYVGLCALCWFPRTNQRLLSNYCNFPSTSPFRRRQGMECEHKV